MAQSAIASNVLQHITMKLMYDGDVHNHVLLPSQFDKMFSQLICMEIRTPGNFDPRAARVGRTPGKEIARRAQFFLIGSGLY